ncbi:modular serine protease-like [Lycorma delicatula]|uniref:modular serine protease-like n=1 Tax=Lycorma delicatula TaxID=130591 RepID=UPI003F51942C
MSFHNKNVFVFKSIISLIIITGLSLEVFSKNVKEREKQSAKYQKFICRNGQVIKQDYICNGKKDCDDASDELQATCLIHNVTCSKNEFRCAYGACIDVDKKCDGITDCADNSDELRVCTSSFIFDEDNTELIIFLQDFKVCNKDEFQCDNGNCIRIDAVCDGFSDCSDKSDETVDECFHENSGCLQDQFACAYGACLDKSVKCNVEIDCADGSDEDYVLCNYTSPERKIKDQPCDLPVLNPDVKYSEVECQSFHNCTPLVSPQKFNSSTEIYINCKEGFIKQQNTATCNNGTWNIIPYACARSILGGKCLLPPFSTGTKYARSKCSNFEECVAIEENEMIDNFQHIFINCKEGFALRNVDNNFVAVCVLGKWQPENTACVKLCEPLKSRSLKVFCEYAGATVNCEEPVRVGTIAKLTCSEGYQQELTAIHFVNLCLPDGKWRFNGVQRCTFKCGELNSQNKLITDGVTANRQYHPWNAGIYKGLRNGTFFHICGGTLITPLSVITAAHCVTFNDGVKVKPATRFRITFAKQYIKYDDKRDNEAVYRNVSRIHIPLAYQGISVNFLPDIAILELSSAVPLGNSINPVCIDIYNKNIIGTSMLGTVVGWGLNSSNLPSEELKKTEVSYISLEECRRVTDLRKHITNDKFCTTERNGSNKIQTGDSGSGVIFEFGGKHYIYGLVSSRMNPMILTNTDFRFPDYLKFIIEFTKNIAKNNDI